MIIAILGPTGVGKTKLSIELAKKYHAEIINCDATQVYQKLDIGSAKATPEEQEGIPHHLLDFVDPKENYTVYDYQRDCRKKIEELQAQQKNIILVGGTGLYLKAALYDYRFVYEENQSQYESWTTEEIYQKILLLDPETEVDQNNRRRLIRALARLENAAPQEKRGNQVLYPAKILALTTDRERLYQRIDQRVLQMMEEGLLEEAQCLYEEYGTSSKALSSAIGYKELFAYFRGELTLEQAVFQIQKNSRHYAKRQYTFFRHQFDLTWFEVNFEQFDKTIEQVETWIEQEKNQTKN